MTTSPPTKRQKTITSFFTKNPHTPKQNLPEYKGISATRGTSVTTPNVAPISSPMGMKRKSLSMTAPVQEQPTQNEETIETVAPTTEKPKKRSLVRRKNVIAGSDSEESEAVSTQSEEEDDLVLPPKKTPVKTMSRQPPSSELFSAHKPPQRTQSMFTPRTPMSHARFDNPSSNLLDSTPVKGIILKDDRQKATAEKNQEIKAKKYSFLRTPRDANKKLPNESGFNPNTLYIPDSFWKEATPFEGQYWQIKKDNWDTIVFFKNGKFYELFEKDADIGGQEFDLKVVDRGYMRMAGVPEASFEYWASKFISKGFKIARVDQLETSLGATMRRRDSGLAASSKKEPQIRRELTKILTAGTLVDENLINGEANKYCLSIKEEIAGPLLPPTFGICFVDSTTSEFSLCEIHDDTARTSLETLMMQLRPLEMIVETSNLSPTTLKLLKSWITPTPIWNYLTPRTQFWDAQQTKDQLTMREWFHVDGEAQIPPIVSQFQDSPLIMSALGGMISYLDSIKLADTLLPLKNFHHYEPMHHSDALLLDGQTLLNLEILKNTMDDSEKGTLWELVNQCSTGYGQRQLKKWLCHPLKSIELITLRAASIAVWEQDKHMDLAADLSRHLSKLPDFERSVSRIHGGYAKLKEFLRTMEAFRELRTTILDLSHQVEKMEDARFLKESLSRYPVMEIQQVLEYFDHAFDHQQAEAEGIITPTSGTQADYDALDQEIADIKQKLEDYRVEQSRKLRVQITYKDIGHDLYLLEVPINQAGALPKSWPRVKSTKTAERCHPTEVTEWVMELKEAMETQSQIRAVVQRRIYAKFSESLHLWTAAIGTLADIDCLIGLARASQRLAGGGVVCSPEWVIADNETSILELKGMRHPCAGDSVATDFIPNDTVLGGSQPRMMLLTGPNMGGKSTLLRQTCIAVILAHLGCKIPAISLRLTPVDRIFTRIGANDNILAGQSTFMVELSETAKILQNATPRSLVILDELGRGTSTFDGYAIAWSVMYSLIHQTSCIGLFSTHYGMLTDEFASMPLVSMQHMACKVDDDNKTVTFLYKLTAGACPRSYGLNVANMAGIPRRIIVAAEQASEHFEKSHYLRDIRSAGGAVSFLQKENIRSLLSLPSTGGDGETKIQPSIYRSLRNILRLTK